jgi:hypothetical protein
MMTHPPGGALMTLVVLGGLYLVPKIYKMLRKK